MRDETYAESLGYVRYRCKKCRADLSSDCGPPRYCEYCGDGKDEDDDIPVLKPITRKLAKLNMEAFGGR